MTKPPLHSVETNTKRSICPQRMEIN